MCPLDFFLPPGTTVKMHRVCTMHVAPTTTCNPGCPYHFAVTRGGGITFMAWGRFSHSANYYIVYPGNTPENYPPAEA